MLVFKKPKFWDLKKPNFYSYMLLPITLLISFINYFKNFQNSKKTKIKTICVGNFYVGGTGKTSLSIKIHEILQKKKIKSCFVKKYYKNQTDEQNLLKECGKLFLSNTRINALKNAEKEKYEIAILDDGLQDKSIHYDVSFVCFNNINWVGNGMTIPSGPLREKITKLKYYKNVCLNGNLENLDFIKNEILKINKNINIHIGKYDLVNLNEYNKNENYIVFSGIGNHKTFVSMIKNYGLKVLKELEYPDHYPYKKKDIEEILDIANNLNCKILTTEKDYFRINKSYWKNIKFVKSKLVVTNEEKLIDTII